MSGAAIWWLRSPYTGDSNYVWFVGADGSDGNGDWYCNSYGVRPALMEPCDE